MTTQTTNNSLIDLPKEDHLQEDILPQEDQHPKTHFQLQIIQQTNRQPFTEAHQDQYSTNVTINPFKLLEIHNQLIVLEGHLSQLTDKVAAIVVEIHKMTHQN
jgi:hypothetical protein